MKIASKAINPQLFVKFIMTTVKTVYMKFNKMKMIFIKVTQKETAK